MSAQRALPPRILMALLATAASGLSSAGDVQIGHVTVVSAERKQPMRDAWVRIHDGRIVTVSNAAGALTAGSIETLDGTGLYLTPGLIDSHVHLGDIPGMRADQEAQHPEIAKSAREQIPHSYLLFGFTTLIDLISTPQGMKVWKSHSLVPDTYFCGGAPLMDGYAMNYAPKPDRYRAWPYMLIEPGMHAPDGIDAAEHTPRAVVARMKKDGAICVKTFFERGFGGASNLPVPKVETIRDLVSAAHAAGMPVLIHANSAEAQRFALDAGVDIVAHGLWNWQDHAQTPALVPAVQKILDDELTHGIGVQPTMQVLHGISDLFNPTFLADPRLSRVYPAALIEWYRSPEGQWFRMVLAEDEKLPDGAGADQLDRIVNEEIAPVIERGRRATAYLVSHRGRLLFGTDTPSAPTYANPPGLNAWLEMHHLVEAGQTPAAIFKSATLTNAQALKLDGEIGTVQAGKRANLLLLRRDPTQTIEAYADIQKVILNGRVIDPSELAAR